MASLAIELTACHLRFEVGAWSADVFVPTASTTALLVMPTAVIMRDTAHALHAWAIGHAYGGMCLDTRKVRNVWMSAHLGYSC
jgi:hypothetical protein